MQIIIGQKREQTQRFLTNGTRIPVTLVAVAPNHVLAVKTMAKDGYNAVQIGAGARKNSTRSQLGTARKAHLTAASKFIKEVRFFDFNETMPEMGTSISLSDVLQPGDIVSVTGTSKGKGWAGVVKRHNFRGGPRTHGQSDRERAPGSLGQTTTPGRVYKGKRMAGRMGSETVTVQNLFVADVIGDKIYLAGLVPGHINSFIVLKKTGKLADKKISPMLRMENMDVEPVAVSMPEQAEDEKVSETDKPIAQDNQAEDEKETETKKEAK